jgi:hypothetical protein
LGLVKPAPGSKNRFVAKQFFNDRLPGFTYHRYPPYGNSAPVLKVHVYHTPGVAPRELLIVTFKGINSRFPSQALSSIY